MPHDAAQILEEAASTLMDLRPKHTGTHTYSWTRPTATWSHPHPPPHRPVHPHFHHHGHFGHIVAWVTFGIFVLAFLAFLFTALRKPKATRLFNWIFVGITFISALTYYALATGVGVFVAHWIDWFSVTPLLAGSLSILAGLSFLDTVIIALAAAVAEVPGAIGALAYHGPRHHHGFQWGFFVFSLLPFAYILYTLLVPGRKAAATRGGLVSKLFTFLALWEAILYIPYPVIIALSYYTHVIPPRWAFLTFAILDILTQVVFGAVLVYGVGKYPETDVVLGETWVVERGPYGYEAVVQEEVTV